jgi:hypothetical protein
LHVDICIIIFFTVVASCLHQGDKGRSRNMAHRTELNGQIAVLAGISKHTVDRIGVNLNKGGLLRSGGRGRHAPDMGPGDLTNIILAMLGAESTGRVFEAVSILRKLQAADGKKFGDVLVDICRDQKMAAAVMQLSIVRNYPQATIYWKDETGTRIGRIEDFRSLSEQVQPGLRIVASLNGKVLSEFVRLVAVGTAG